MDDIREKVEQLERLLREQRLDELRQWFIDLRVQDIAELLGELDDDAPYDLLLGLLEPDRQVRTFAYLDLSDQPAVLAALSPLRRRNIVGELDSDDRAALIDELEPEQAERLIAELPPEERDDMREMLAYDEASVGRLMNTEFVAVRPYWTIAEALDHIRIANENGIQVNSVHVTQLQGSCWTRCRCAISSSAAWMNRCAP